VILIGDQRGPTPGRRSSLARTVIAWLSAAVVIVLVAASLTAYFRYRSVWNSIRPFAGGDVPGDFPGG
jgi:hypothetical protein